MKDLNCGISLLNGREIDPSCIIEIRNGDVKGARYATDQLLLRIEKEYGDQIVKGAKVE